MLSINLNEVKELLKENDAEKIQEIIDEAKERANNVIDKINEYVGLDKKMNIKIEFLPNNIVRIYLKNSLEKGMVSLEKISAKSDGIKRFLLICLEIMSVPKDIPSILLIDEPEINLNPLKQTNLLELFEHYSEKNNIFIIYTTHSPFMVCHNNSMSKKIVYRSKKDNSTNILDYYDTVKKDEMSLADINSMDLTLANSLELMEEEVLNRKYDEIILVEGPCDKIIIDRALKKWNIENKLVVLIKGWNIQNTLDFLFLKIKDFDEANKVKVIVDNDHAGLIIKDLLSRKIKNNEMLKMYSDFDSEYEVGDYKLEQFVNSKRKLRKVSIERDGISLDDEKHLNLKDFLIN